VNGDPNRVRRPPARPRPPDLETSDEFLVRHGLLQPPPRPAGPGHARPGVPGGGPPPGRRPPGGDRGAPGYPSTQRDNLPNAIERLQEEVKRTRKEIEDLKLKIATGALGTATANGDEARDVSGVKVLGKIVDGLDANGQRQLSDTLLARLKSGVVVLGREAEGKVSIIVRVSDDLTSRVKAGNVIKEIVPIVGGKGGGRPDMAEGGGTDPGRLSEAIDASYAVIEKMLA